MSLPDTPEEVEAAFRYFAPNRASIESPVSGEYREHFATLRAHIEGLEAEVESLKAEAFRKAANYLRSGPIPFGEMSDAVAALEREADRLEKTK